MKTTKGYLLIFGVLLLLLGCQQSTGKNKDNPSEPKEKIVEGEENNMNKKDIFDFKHIDKAPDATENQPIDKVIKVYFSEWSIDERPYATGIDIERNEIYIYPVIGRRGLRAREGIVEIENSEEVREILEMYDVQDWEKDYTIEDPDSYEDGYSWDLWLQFEDGTVEKHGGAGTDDRITPENYDAFFEDLQTFVEERTEDNED